MYSSTLEKLLAEDGVTFLPGSGPEHEVNCLSNNHHDENQSMTINVTDGTFWCRGCGIKGDALEYLTVIRDIQKAVALATLKKMGWKDKRLEHSEEKQQEKEYQQKGLPKHIDEPYEQLSDTLILTNSYEYSDADGRLISMVGEYVSESTIKKICYTPAERGGWWVCGPMNTALPEEDRRIKKYPLYQLNRLLNSDSSEQVWFLDDERCVDAVSSGATDAPLCTASMVRGKPTQTDFSVLAGRRVCLIASTSKESRTFMKGLGAYLNRNGCAVKYVLPKGDGDFSIFDAIARGGATEAMKWIRSIGVTEHDNKPESQTLLPPMAETEHFVVMGLIDDKVVFQLKKTYQVRTVKAANLLGEGVLLTLAPQNWWLSQCGEKGLTKPQRMSFADAIIRAAEQKGIFDVSSSLYGRGAAEIDGKVVFNVGDGILAEDDDKMLTKKIGFEHCKGEIFIPGKVITVEDSKNAERYLRSMYDAVMSYRWQHENYGRAFVGWIVSAVIGGALDFRPMLWILAPAQTGKTYLLDRVMHPLLGNMLTPISDTSEAGLAYQMGKDSLPAYIDEFEPGAGMFSAQKWQSVLKLVRQATSGGGQRLRAAVGNQQTGVVTCQPRFSIFLSSIDRPNLSEADSSRFFFIRLRREPVKDWPKLRHEFGKVLKRERCLAMRSHIVRHAARLIDRTRELESLMQQKIQGKSTREYQIIAALTAGAELCSGEDTLVVAPEKDTRDAEVSELSSLMHIMDSIASTITGHAPKMSLRECMSSAVYGHPDPDRGGRVNVRSDDDKALGIVAERFGVKVLYDEFNRRGMRLAVDPYNPQLHHLFRGTKWESVDLHEHFLGISGARVAYTKSGRRKRTDMAGAKKEYIEFNPYVLESLGFTQTENPDPNLLRRANETPPYAHDHSNYRGWQGQDASRKREEQEIIE